MPDLFSALNHGIEGAPLLALVAAFGWGVLSLVLSPCHLASIPLIIGFVGGQGDRISTMRAFQISLLFTLGIMITIALVGILTAALGRIVGYAGPWVNYVVAVLFFGMGLHLLGAVPVPSIGMSAVDPQQKGLTAALLLGLVFGLALGPCTFAFMAPVLGVSLKVAANSMPLAVLLVAAYAAGHGTIVVLGGTSTELVRRLLSWNGRSRGTVLIKALCGVLLLAGGLYLIYTAP